MSGPDGGADGRWPEPSEGSCGRPLEGVRVLDLGQYLAGPLAAVLLADQGAHVTRIEPPGGPRWDVDANAILLRGREVRTLDLRDTDDRAGALELATSVDVLIENFRPGVMEQLGLGVERCLERNPRLVFCSLPGFGADDPRSSMPGWEGVVLAAAGAYATGSEELLQGEWWPGDGPAFSPLLLGSVFAGAQAATAVVAALLARERDGAGQHVEVPLHDAFFEALGARALSFERNAPKGASLGSGFYRCADGGYVSLITVWFRHLEWFLRAAGVGSWIDDGIIDYERLRSDPDAGDELKERLVELLTTRPAREWEELGRGAGVPIAALRSSREWMHEDHALASGALVDGEAPQLGTFRGPGRAVRITESGPEGARIPARPAASTHAPPLEGVRVLDMTRVLAAPSASRLLAEMGADVVKADADPSDRATALRQPVFHEQTNRGKRSIIVDLRTTEGRQRFEELLVWADVFITNYTMPTVERLGLDETSVRSVAPDVVYVYLNAFGTDGPWSDLRGYAEVANTVTGITERTLGEGPPSGAAPTIDLPRCPFTDYAAGILAAYGALTGWWKRTRTGISTRVETSLAVTASWEQLPYLVDHDAKTWDEPRSPARGWNALQRLYRTAEDWVFVGMDEEQAETLLAEAGVPASNDALEDRLQDLIAGWSTVSCVERVRSVGGGAQPVTELDALMVAGGPADQRGLRLEQHSEEFGAVIQPGPTIRFSRTPMRAGTLPGPFGADGDEVIEQVRRQTRRDQTTAPNR